MKKIFALVAALVATVSLNAQTSERIVVRAGENIAQAVSPNGYYRFGNFTDGMVILKNGSRSRGLFNYNIVTGEMLYIGPKGDTMAMAAPEDIDHLIIGGNTEYIYNNKVFLEVLGEAKPGQLVKKIKITVESDKKGGYGQSTQTSSQDQFSSFVFNSRVVELNYDLAVTKKISYYWVDDNHNLQPVTKKSSLKLVSKDKQLQVETFIEENKINFNNGDDLRKLLAYAGSL
jgi:hypothetical protein